MATKPTRGQAEAADKLALALLTIAEAARLDAPGTAAHAKYADLLFRVASASAAFDRDAIVSKALEARGRALGLRSGTAELLMLVGLGDDPIEALLGDDPAFLALVAKAEAELGEV